MDKSEKILITGGRGFVGKTLVKELHKAGYLNTVALGSSDFNLLIQEESSKMFLLHKPNVVIHLAAKVGGIGANMHNPGKFCYENLIMGVNTIECAREYGVKKIIVAGTICSYPRITPVPFKEEYLFQGIPESTNAPYGLSKKMLLTMGQAYRSQYNLNFIYLLPVNLFGPEDSFDLENSHVIPAMIRKFHEAKTSKSEQVVLWGDGSPTREFLYVEDCAKAFVAAMELYDGPEPINVGTGKEIPMRDLAETIRGIVQYNGRVTWDASKPNGQPRRCLDVTRAKERLGWEATTDFKEGLKRTYEWYLETLDRR
jgi:GDP-L-fucose synthase